MVHWEQIRKLVKNSQKMAKNDVFRRFGRFGNLHRSFGRTDSAEIGRSFGRSFGFGRTLVNIISPKNFREIESHYHLKYHEQSKCTSQWKLQNVTAAATIFSQKIRQINVFLKNFTINWFDEKIVWDGIFFCKNLSKYRFTKVPFYSRTL